MSSIINLEDHIRKKIADFIPDAIMRILASYMEFSQSEAGEKECKDYAARHTAAKAALVHLELMLKLAKNLGLPNPQAENHNQQIVLATMLQEAEEELSTYKKRKRSEI